MVRVRPSHKEVRSGLATSAKKIHMLVQTLMGDRISLCSGLWAQIFCQISARPRPVALDSPNGSTKHPSCFIDCKASKEAAFDNALKVWCFFSQSRQSCIDIDKLRLRGMIRNLVVVYVDVRCARPALFGKFSARMIDQNLPHGPRGGCEIMVLVGKATVTVVG